MIVKTNDIILVFLIFAIFAITPFWSSITNSEATLPLNKEEEMQGSASFVARNEALVVNFACREATSSQCTG